MILLGRQSPTMRRRSAFNARESLGKTRARVTSKVVD